MSVLGRGRPIHVFGSGSPIYTPGVGAGGGGLAQPGLLDFGSGLVQHGSGAVVSGHVSGSGNVVVGTSPTCRSCGAIVHSSDSRLYVYVCRVSSSPRPSPFDPVLTFCLACARFDAKRGRFTGVEEGLRLACPLGPDTPPGILADWYEDQGNSPAAEHLRSAASR